MKGNTTQRWASMGLTAAFLVHQLKFPWFSLMPWWHKLHDSWGPGSLSEIQAISNSLPLSMARIAFQSLSLGMIASGSWELLKSICSHSFHKISTSIPKYSEAIVLSLHPISALGIAHSLGNIWNQLLPMREMSSCHISNCRLNTLGIPNVRKWSRRKSLKTFVKHTKYSDCGVL